MNFELIQRSIYYLYTYTKWFYQTARTGHVFLVYYVTYVLVYVKDQFFELCKTALMPYAYCLLSSTAWYYVA